MVPPVSYKGFPRVKQAFSMLDHTPLPPHVFLPLSHLAEIKVSFATRVTSNVARVASDFPSGHFGGDTCA